MSRLAVWEFLHAVREFVFDGFSTVSREQYEARLLVCQSCPTRDGPACARERGGCGCRIAVKAIARSWNCPQGRWPGVTADDESSPQSLPGAIPPNG